ncbi:unnamed protein product [Vicia faba]|uniref:Uncharacterized protein n=1 Tax=Vicia faba TaxID=3906 RepID=A0AAV0ZA33_VICFA|nr:unnamed protein product [Vicia faba]
MEPLESRPQFTLGQRRLTLFGSGTRTDFCYSGFLLSVAKSRDFPLSVSIPETTAETYTANEVQVIAYFLCPETLTALLLLSRQAGDYQDVVKEVGLEPAINLAKYTASE